MLGGFHPLEIRSWSGQAHEHAGSSCEKRPRGQFSRIQGSKLQSSGLASQDLRRLSRLSRPRDAPLKSSKLQRLGVWARFFRIDFLEADRAEACIEAGAEMWSVQTYAQSPY